MNTILNYDYNAILFLLGEYAIRIIVSLLILVIGKWAISKIVVLLEKLVFSVQIDEMLSHFLLNVTKTLLFIFVILAALSNLGIETTSFVAVLGAIGLAIGMAFKDTFSNIGAGTLIIFFKPFNLGDFIEIGGSSGTAKEINLFNTRILTSDNRSIIIPNSQVISSRIVNYSSENKRRVDLTFSIGYENNIKIAKDLILKIALENDKIFKGDINESKKPFVGVSTLGESSVDLIMKLWVDTKDYWDVKFYMLEKVKEAFDENNINIPYPQLDVNYKEK